MQNTDSPKPTSRTARSHATTESLTRVQAQHLERLYENATSAKNTNRNLAHNDLDVINGQSLLNIRSIPAYKHRRRKLSLLDDRIIINVCGDRYETHRTTLELYPDTLLGNAKRRKYYYDKIRNEYFFDRHRGCFESILYYYQSHGRIRRPDYISLDIFLEEITFFQLGQEALKQIRKDENIKEVNKIRLPKNRIRRSIWATMEYPNYSIMAKIINIISLLMILISTIAFAVESLPQYVNLDDLNCGKESNTSSYTKNETHSSSSADYYVCNSYYLSSFFLIQAISIGFFTIEFVLRISSTPSFLDFIKNLMNWIDLLAVVPFYISLGIRLSGHQNEINSNTYVALRLLRILRLARVFKFFRVFRNIKSLRVLATTVKQSLLDFLIMIIILTLLAFLFGAAAYYAENDSNGLAYDSILKATYWGIVSITGVGYGDITPITPIGRIIACLCALFGAATISMLVSVLVDRYQRVYARKLYVNDETIDFDDYSDDENNDTDSREIPSSIRYQRSSKIEDPDARAKENAINNQINSTEMTQTSDLQNDNRLHFIIGYVDNENDETSHDLVEKISSVVADKQSSGDNISLNIISNNHSPHDVQFHIESSSSDEDLTDIGYGGRESVLKTFQRPLTPTNEQSNNFEINV